MTKKLFLWFVLVLVGCGQTAEVEPAVVSEGASELQILVPADDFAVGNPRVPFVIFDGPDRVSEVQEVRLTLFDTAQDPPISTWSGTAAGYEDYVVPYWVVYPEIPTAGVWGLEAEILRTNGSSVQARFAIQVEAESESPDVGMAVPPSENRTLATESDLEKLTTDFAPDPALYQMTVAEAVANGRPTVVAFNTPKFCQTSICAPVLESVKTVFNDLKDEVNFIHIEIYKEFDPLVTADEVEAWGLSSEPWTFVLDADGRVAARLAGPVSPRELTAELEGLVGR